MNLTNVRFFLFSTALSTLAAGTWPLVPGHRTSVSIDDQTLFTIRGADRNYTKTSTASCDAMGVQAPSQVLGGSWAPQSTGCASVNLGWQCGGCTVTMSRPFGVMGPVNPIGNGQGNNDVGPCGTLLAGTCGCSNPNTNPPTYGCVGEMPVLNANTGQPYSCSDLIALANQASGGGGSN
jgi:hypothetical protein